MYHIEIQTADEDAAGTDSDIYVQFTTASGGTSTKRLLDNSGDDFEQAYNDFYSSPGSLAAGDSLASVTIQHDGRDAWKMAWLKVSAGGRTWKAETADWFRNETKTLPLTPAVGRPNWMSAIGPATTVDQMNIPGTHDSGTSFLASGNYRRTHDLNIRQQLLLGIRYFDVRLRCVVNPNWTPAKPKSERANFTVHHEDTWCYLYFDRDSWVAPADAKEVKRYVLQDFLKFLKEFPSEFILMQVQQEYNTEPGFSEYFEEIVARSEIEDKFLITDTYPTYADAKGKIVVLNMNSALNDCGIPLQGPKFLDTPALYVENHWMDSNKELKWDKVEAALKKALENNAGQWVINYVSDGSGAMHPREFAKYLNDWVEKFIKKHGTGKHYGTVLTDFPTRSLVGALLAKYLN